MLAGNLIMRPVAYDAFSTGISGRTFVMPIASTPPRAPSSNARSESPRSARPVRPTARAQRGGDAASWESVGAGLVGGGQRLAAQPLYIAQIGQLHLPVPVDAQLGR